MKIIYIEAVIKMSEENDELLEDAIDVYLSSLKYLNNYISEPAEKYGLSFEQFLILRKIATQKNVTLMDIASERNVTRSAISRQIKVLLKHNYIYQEPSPSDKRKFYLHLTADGVEAEKDISLLAANRFDKWVNYYGKDKAREIIDFIHDFANSQLLN